MGRRSFWALVVLLLLVAAALRFVELGQVPGGFSQDEVANWLIAGGILRGEHAIYFTAGYGHEPLYHYVQALTIAVFGDNWLGLRYASGALGLVAIAVVFVVTRRLAGRPAALLAAGWMAVTLWPVFYSRVGLRAVMLPCTAGLFLYFLLRALDEPAGLAGQRPGSHRRGVGLSYWLLAGLFLGVSLYTYMAARILPATVAAMLLCLMVKKPHDVGQHWAGIALMLAVAASLTAPLGLWLVHHPAAEYRVAEVSEPLNRLLEGDPSLVAENLVANLGMFTGSGDPWPQQNVPGRAVFTDMLSVLLFYAGVVISLWRCRQRRFYLLLIWLAAALVPSIVSSVAPSSIRTIMATVVVFALPAVAVVELHRLYGRRCGERAHMICLGAPLQVALCVLILAPGLVGTVYDYFVRWPRDEAMQFFYQTALCAVGRQLDRLPTETSAAVAGLSVHSLDRATLALETQGDAGKWRLCDTRETLVLPAGGESWLFVPEVVPLDADLRERLEPWGGIRGVAVEDGFVAYRLAREQLPGTSLGSLEREATLSDGTPVELPASFGNRLALLGYEWLTVDARPGGSVSALSYWTVEQPGRTRLKIYLHVLDNSGSLVAQHDGLGSPVTGWAGDDLVIQKHVIELPDELGEGFYELRLGIYEAQSGERLVVLGGDGLLLPSIEVGE
jgi:4-amino-4-deoxy-L-arabinose transferase-like glycosyltransferase